MGSVVSDNESVVALSLRVLVSDKAVATLSLGLALNFKQMSQILKQLHLLRIVLRIVFNMALVCPQVLDQTILLFQLSIEELLVGFEFGGESLLGVTQVLGFQAQSLLESLVNVCLHIVGVVLALGLLVLAKTGAHVLVHALPLRLDLRANSVVVAFTFVVVHLNFSVLVSECAKAFDLGGEALLLLLDFRVDSCDQASQLLHRLRLGVIKLLLEF